MTFIVIELSFADNKIYCKELRIMGETIERVELFDSISY